MKSLYCINAQQNCNFDKIRQNVPCGWKIQLKISLIYLYMLTLHSNKLKKKKINGGKVCHLP